MLVYFSHQWQMYHGFKYFRQHIVIFMKKVKMHVLEIDADPDRPDRQTLGADPDPDPQHSLPLETLHAGLFWFYTWLYMLLTLVVLRIYDWEF